MRTRVNMALAAGSYLQAPDGRLRVIHGLELLTRDAVALDTVLCWDDAAPAIGYCYLWRRLVLLHPTLYEMPASVVREVISHELAHVACGRSRTRVWRYQAHRYGDLLTPAWMA